MNRPTRDGKGWILITALCTLVYAASHPAVANAASNPCRLQSQYLIFFGERIADPFSMSPGQAPLRERAMLLIDDIAAGWQGGSSMLLIAGHLDEAEAQAAPDLDVARALAVREALVARGVDPKVIWTRGDAFEAPMVLRPGPELQNRYVSVTAPTARAECRSPIVQ